MSETPSDRHNRLAREFVTMAGTQTHSGAELMVVMESTMLATMHLLVRLYAVKPTDASIYLEAALQAATERYPEADGNKPS